MPKKPRKQHVTHYMNPNPWENPKGFKKPKKVKKAQAEVSETEWAPKNHFGLVYGGLQEFANWQSYTPEVVTVTNPCEDWTPCPISNNFFELVWDDDDLCYKIGKVTTPEQKAQRYVDHYPGANPVDLMIAFHNEQKRELTKVLDKQIEYQQKKLESAQESIDHLCNELNSAQIELIGLRQKMNAQQAQFERIVSISITATESVRHFREED